MGVDTKMIEYVVNGAFKIAIAAIILAFILGGGIVGAFWYFS